MNSDGLAKAARRWSARRRGQLAIFGSVVASAAVISLGLAVSANRPVSADSSVSATKPTSAVKPVSHPTSATTNGDWQWMSSAGAEVRVPASWVVDDAACSTSPTPSLGVARRACDAKVKGVRPLVEINGIDVPKPVGQTVTIDGQPAHRAKITLPGGLTQGIIRFDKVPITVTATLRDTALLERIMDSVSLSAVDHVGCQTGTPPAGRPAASTTGTEQLIPSGPTEIIACQYSRSDLQASARLDQRQAARLVAALNSAPAGANPDRRCLEAPAYPITVRATYADRPPVTVHIRYWGCTGRGLDNGARISQVTLKVVDAAIASLKT